MSMFLKELHELSDLSMVNDETEAGTTFKVTLFTRAPLEKNCFEFLGK